MADILMHSLEAADKVVIGGNWYALVDGALMGGPMSRGGRIELVDAYEVSDYSHDEEGAARVRRATLMLEAVRRPMIDPDATLPRPVLSEAMRQDAAMLRKGGRLTP